MSKNRLSLFKTASVLVAVSALAACSSSSSGTDSNESGSTGASKSTAIVAAYTGAIDSLDPQHTDYGQTNLIDSAVYEALVTYTSDNKLVSALASQYTLSPQATSVAVTLRPGVKFHDGTALTATDVKFSLDFSLDRYTSLGTGIGGLFSSYESTTIVDTTHLTINLKAADSLFLGELSKAYIMESKLVTTNAGSGQGQSWLADHDAGRALTPCSPRSPAAISSSSASPTTGAMTPSGRLRSPSDASTRVRPSARRSRPEPSITPTIFRSPT
ncbi:MAG: ddpA 3 [Pseudonocardiales bacterium]|nr:ddpA 3 [Pseudonocardiales bacterium]